MKRNGVEVTVNWYIVANGDQTVRSCDGWAYVVATTVRTQTGGSSGEKKRRSPNDANVTAHDSSQRAHALPTAALPSDPCRFCGVGVKRYRISMWSRPGPCTQRSRPYSASRDRHRRSTSSLADAGPFPSREAERAEVAEQGRPVGVRPLVSCPGAFRIYRRLVGLVSTAVHLGTRVTRRDALFSKLKLDSGTPRLSKLVEHLLRLARPSVIVPALVGQLLERSFFDLQFSGGGGGQVCQEARVVEQAGLCSLAYTSPRGLITKML